MAENSAGRVLLIPKGVFTIGTNYTPLDFVAFGSNNYVCKKATDGTKTPVEDTASWQMLAAGFDSHNIAAEYSEEAIYHAGDICISGGNLYKAKQDINAAETFTAGHWEEITVGQELTSLETTKADASDVTTLKEKVGTTALTTTAADLSGAVNEVKAATDTNASAITQLNSDNGKAIYSSDLFGTYDLPTFVQWDANTSNCPYKVGLTQGQEGFAIVYGNKSGWHTVLAFQKGSDLSNGGWKHTFEGGTNVGWVEYITTESLNKKTFSTYSSNNIDTDADIESNQNDPYWTMTFMSNNNTGAIPSLTGSHLFTVIHWRLDSATAMEQAYDTTGKLIAHRYKQWWTGAWTAWTR